MFWQLGDRFQLESPLGKGGMGEVWAARHVRDGSPVAIKLLTGKSAHGDAFRAAFGNEIRLAAGLTHPDIVEVLDHGIVPEDVPETRFRGAPWLAMERVYGTSLSRQAGWLHWPQVQTALLRLLDALAHAHARGVVHRDLKPGNVLVDLDTGLLKLTDFGLAHATDGDPVPGRERLLMGTPQYMAPEQFGRRWRDQGPWTDLYALGCLAYALVAGSPPFPEATNIAAAKVAHRYAEPEALPPGAPVPPGFDHWLAVLLEKDPGRRWQRAADAAFALRQLGDAPADAQPVGDAARPHEAQTLSTDFYSVATDTEETPHTGSTTLSLAAGLLPRDLPQAPVPASWRSAVRPVHASRVGLSVFGLRDVPLEGREPERDALWQTLREVHSDGGVRAVVLSGPAGVGKTRLARWLTERAHETGAAHVLWARHDREGGVGHGLGPMLARFLSTAGLEAHQATRRLQRINEGLAPGTEHWRTILEAIHPEAEGSAHFEDDGQRFAALGSFFARLSASRPLILCLDDAHHEPRAVQLAQALREVPGLRALVVLTAIRDAGYAQAQAGLRALDGARTLKLAPLDDAALTGLLQRLLGLDRDLALDVARGTGGNPLLALQLVGHWIATARLEVSTLGWRLAHRKAVERELETLWEDRLRPVEAAHGEPALRALELAAIIGPEHGDTAWGQVAFRAGLADPPGCTDTLLRLGLAVAIDPHGPGGWRFAHPELRNALERRADAEGRTQAHHRAAAALVDPSLDGGERRAVHLFQAGDLLDAAPYLLASAEWAHEHGDYVRGRALLDLFDAGLDALDVPPDGPERAAGWLIGSRIAHREGNLARADTLLDKAEATARDTDPIVWVKASLQRGDVIRKQGDLRDARQVLEAALGRAHVLEDPILEAQVRLSLAEALIDLAELDEAEAHLRLSLALAEGRVPRTEARAWQELAELYKERGELDTAWAHFEHARTLTRQAGDRWTHASVLNSMGDVARYSGRTDEALELYAASGKAYADIGSSSVVYTRYNAALVYLERREFPVVERILEQTLPAFEAMGHRATVADARIARAACLASRGEPEAAAADLDAALQAYIDTGVSDVDSAELAEVAAEILTAHAVDPSGAWRIAIHVWTALGRADRAAAARETLRS